MKIFETEKTGKETSEVALKNRDGKVTLPVIPKDEWESDEHGVIGYVCTKSGKASEDSSILKVASEDLELEFPLKTEAKGKLLGYVKVKDGGYIGIYKKRKLFILLLLFLLLLFGILAYRYTDAPEGVKKELGFADTVDSDGVVTNGDRHESSDEMIKFAGYDFVYASEEEPYILLENPESNDVYFTYTILDNLDGSVVLEETGLIGPGKAFQWDAKSVLPEGEHNVTFYVHTYGEDFTEYTSAVMDDITIKIY